MLLWSVDQDMSVKFDMGLGLSLVELLRITHGRVRVWRQNKSRFDPKHVQGGAGSITIRGMFYMDANWICDRPRNAKRGVNIALSSFISS